MKNTARRVLLVMMLAGMTVATSGCDPAGAEAIGRLGLELYGSILAIVIAVIVIIAGIPSM